MTTIDSWAGEITVGPDKDYQTIQDAVDAAGDHYIIYIDPGDYEEGVAVNKLLHMIGQGSSPLDTRIYSTSNVLRYDSVPDDGTSPTLIVDNLHMENTGNWRRAFAVQDTYFPNLTIELYNCFLDADNASDYPLGMDGASRATVNLFNCTLYKGYAHFVNIDTPESVVNLYHVELNGAIDYQSCGYGVVNDDYVTTPTVDYGYEYKLHSYAFGSIAVEDLSLDLAAYYRSITDLTAILEATDGTAFKDLTTFLSTYGRSLQDLPTDLAAYFQDRQNLATYLKILATGWNDLPAALQALGQGREDLAADLKSLAWTGKDLAMMLSAVNPLVFNDLSMSLSATDGTIINDLTMYLAAIKRAPQYKSVVAQRVSSVISEVT